MRLKVKLNFLKFLNLIKFNYHYFYTLFPFFFYFLKISNFTKNIFLFTKKSKILFIANFLKVFSNFQLKTLNDICVVDYYNKKNRYKIIYNLSSLKTGLRIFLITFLNQTNLFINSLNFLFESSNWLEREVWDLFGIFFIQHNDLRRILTDYGFKGYPFRKDFPLTGYIELRYDDQKHDIVYEPLSLAQELRFFNFSSGWELDN